jgi:hypothetical protein
MPNTIIAKVIVKYALFFETICFMFAAASMLGALTEVYFLFLKENWFQGVYKTLNIFILEYFILSFVIVSAAKASFAVIRKATKSGKIKIEL